MGRVNIPGTSARQPRAARRIVAAALVIAAAAIFTGCFTDFLKLKPTEKRIARNLDFADPLWPEQLLEIVLPSCKKDFSVYSAFFYTGGEPRLSASAGNSGGESSVTLVYASQAGLDEIRGYYRELLEDPVLSENNGPGVLELDGKKEGRKVRVRNYFSEISRLIQVDMDMEGESAGLIRNKVVEAFPHEALEAVPEIAAFAAGESGEGYVLYNYNTFASDVYANIPLFSRAYIFAGSMETLRERINALGERFTDPATALIGGGSAEIKHGPWLYQIQPVENGEKGQVKVALIIQAIPKH